MAREFHLFQRFSLVLVNEFQTWICLLTDFLGAYYWAIPVLNATVASSRKLGELAATMFTCLSRRLLNSIEFFYDIIHHNLKIRAHIQHNLTYLYHCG